MEHKLVQDDDGHWYILPIEKEAAFEGWVDSQGWEKNDYESFDKYRIGGSPSNIIFKEYRIG